VKALAGHSAQRQVESVAAVHRYGTESVVEELESILVVVDRSPGASGSLAKAVFLAQHFDAKVELFLCDSERAYAMRQAYDQTGTEQSRHDCLAGGRQYLEALRSRASAPGVQISIDVVCESPLYEAIVHKILRSQPDLVIKSAGGEQVSRRCIFDTNDWQLMRTCPTTLMLTRGRIWHTRPQFAAMVDVSGQETPGLVRDILRASDYLAVGCRGGLDVVYSEREEALTEDKDRRAGVLKELVQDLHIQSDRLHLLSGDPERTLPAFAAHRYDVLVLGALIHHEVLAPLVGSLTGKLVEALDCDFILAKPSAYRCPIQQPSATVADVPRSAGAARGARRMEIVPAPRDVSVVVQKRKRRGSVLWQWLFGD
jgi:universal stress protein E